MIDWIKPILAALLVGFLLIASVSAQQPQAYSACNKAAIYDASTNGATQIVASGGPILICGYTFLAAGTVNVGLVYGTGTNCATGQVKITPAFQFTTGLGIADASPYFRGMNAPGNQALCINTSAGQAVQAVVYYYQ
jgi:hypothetical protein